MQLTGNMTVIPPETQTPLRPIDTSSQLVEKASKGCSDSFRELVELHQQSLRLFLSRFVHCSTRVDDIAQEVFVAAHCQLKKFRHEAKFSTWLLGIARNKALEFLRTEIAARKNQSLFLEVEIAKRKMSRLVNDKKDFEQAQERLSKLRACLDQLPVRSRTLVNQYYFDQQSATSIAAESMQACNTIRMKLLRIRRVLQKCIMASSGIYTEK